MSDTNKKFIHSNNLPSNKIYHVSEKKYVRQEEMGNDKHYNFWYVKQKRDLDSFSLGNITEPWLLRIIVF